MRISVCSGLLASATGDAGEARSSGLIVRCLRYMRAYDLIKKKRDGGVLAPEELRFLALGASSGEVADEQLAAFLMAVFFCGLGGARELPAFLEAVLHSRRVLDLSRVSRGKVGQHSTGGGG